MKLNGEQINNTNQTVEQTADEILEAINMLADKCRHQVRSVKKEPSVRALVYSSVVGEGTIF